MIKPQSWLGVLPAAGAQRHHHQLSRHRTVVFVATAAHVDDRDSKRTDSTSKDRFKNWSWTGDQYSQQTHSFHHTIRTCTTSTELQHILLANQHQLTGLDVATAWHTAVAKSFFPEEPGTTQLAGVLLDFTTQLASLMDPASLSTCAWALCETELGSEEHLEKLLTSSSSRLTQFKPAELCVLMWAVAANPAAPAAQRLEICQALAKLVENGMSLELFSAHDLSVLSHAIGKVRLRDATLFAAIDKEAQTKLGSFEAADIARLLYGFACTKSMPSSQLIEAMSSYTIQHIHKFEPDDIALLLLALGMLQAHPSGKFSKTVSMHLTAMLPRTAKTYKTKASSTSNPDVGNIPRYLQPNHIAHCCWAAARLEYLAKDFLFVRKTLPYLESNPHLYSLKDINAILWSYASLSISVPGDTLELLVERICEEKLAKQEPHVLSQLLSSLAILAAGKKGISPSLRLTAFAIAVADRCAAGVEVMDPQDVGQLVAALAALQIVGLKETSVKVLRSACTTGAQDVSARLLPRLAWAAVRLGWQDDHDLLSAIAAATAERSGLLSIEAATQAAWSFACLKFRSAMLYTSLADRAVKLMKIDRKGFTAKNIARLAWSLTRLASCNGIELTAVASILGIIEMEDLVDMPEDSLVAVLWAAEQVVSNCGVKRRPLGFLRLLTQFIDLYGAELEPRAVEKARNILRASGYRGTLVEKPEATS